MFRHVNKLVGIVLMATLSTGALSQDVYQSAHHDYRVVPVAEDLVTMVYGVAAQWRHADNRKAWSASHGP